MAEPLPARVNAANAASVMGANRRRGDQSRRADGAAAKRRPEAGDAAAPGRDGLAAGHACAAVPRHRTAGTARDRCAAPRGRAYAVAVLLHEPADGRARRPPSPATGCNGSPRKPALRTCHSSIRGRELPNPRPWLDRCLRAWERANPRLFRRASGRAGAGRTGPSSRPLRRSRDSAARRPRRTRPGTNDRQTDA